MHVFNCSIQTVIVFTSFVIRQSQRTCSRILVTYNFLINRTTTSNRLKRKISTKNIIQGPMCTWNALPSLDCDSIVSTMMLMLPRISSSEKNSKKYATAKLFIIHGHMQCKLLIAAPIINRIAGAMIQTIADVRWMWDAIGDK